MTTEDTEIIAEAHRQAANPETYRSWHEPRFAAFIVRHFPQLEEEWTPPADAMTLTITGDANLIRQIGDALELQGRMHLGQLDFTTYEMEKGLWGALYGELPDNDRGRRTQRARDRWIETLNLLRDGLRTLETHWWGAQARDDQTDLRTCREERKRRAYALWKGIPHALARATGEPLPDDWGIVPSMVAVEVIEPTKKGKR